MFNEFFDGLKSYGKALSTISKYGLWGYVFIPAFITLILTGIIGYTAYGFSDNVGNWMTSWWTWDFLADTVHEIGAWIGGSLIFLIGILALKYIVLIVVAPFMSFLSEKVETRITGRGTAAPFTLAGAWSDLMRGLRISLRNIIRELFFVFILLIFGLIPVIGWIAPILIFLVQAFYAGFGNADFTLERHLKVKQSVYFARQHRWLMIGNGTVFMLLLMTGIGFLFAPPLSTVASTIESIKRLENAGYIPDNASDLV